MFRKTTLANGVRVITDTVPGARSVSLGLLVDAGPQDDPVGQSGLAHLTEHGLFLGTNGRSSTAISRLMDAAGGQMGAFTSRDYTCLYANVLDDYCTYAIDLMGDILVNSTFPEDHIAREKLAIQNEIEASRDNPSDRVHSLLKKHVWPKHPLGRSIVGNPQHMQSLSREDVAEFFHKHYVPDCVTLSAAGNVDHETFVEQSQDALWALSGSRLPPVRSAARFQQAVAFEESPYSQAYFALAVPTQPYAHLDRYMLYVINSLLGGGMSSRLFRQLREERGLVYAISSEIHAYRDGGFLVIEGSTLPEQLMQVVALTLIELYQLASNEKPIDEEELWTAKMQIRGQHMLAADSMHTRMSRLATQELYFGRQLEEFEVLGHFNEIDLASIQKFAEASFLPVLGEASLAVVGPACSECFTEDSLRGLLAEFQGASV